MSLTHLKGLPVGALKIGQDYTQTWEKDLVILALKNELRKLKGKDFADNVVTKHPIAPEILKINVEPIAPRLLINRTAHSDYLRYTQEQAVILREIVEQGKSQNPLNNSLDSAYRDSVFKCPLGHNALESDTPIKACGNIGLLQGNLRKSKTNAVGFSNTKSWLWNRRLSHLNFGAINHLARHGLVRGLPKLKFERDHLCSACTMGKSKKKPHKPKSEDTNQEKVKCLSLKDEALDFIIKFLKMIQVRLKVPVRRIRTINGTEFVNQTLREYYEKVGISHETSVARSPQQNGVVEEVTTACYTQNRSIVRLRHGKTPFELLHDKLPDLSFFYVFGALCYPTNDSENLGKLQPKADIDFDELIAMASEHSSSGPALHDMTPTTISLGLVPNPPPSTPFVPPSRTDWYILFQPMFDELLNPPSSVDRPSLEVIALIAEVVAPEPAASTGPPSSTTVDQDVLSPNVAYMNNNPFFSILILENDSEASSSLDVLPTVVHTAASNSEHVTKWTKDHPLDNIIGELGRPVSTRLQLHEQALFCYYDVFLTSVEPKNYKEHVG
ncbi:putative ribonuclease H-like domain-containing protein [Tanacetum coccineum]